MAAPLRAGPLAHGLADDGKEQLSSEHDATTTYHLHGAEVDRGASSRSTDVLSLRLPAALLLNLTEGTKLVLRQSNQAKAKGRKRLTESCSITVVEGETSPPSGDNSTQDVYQARVDSVGRTDMYQQCRTKHREIERSGPVESQELFFVGSTSKRYSVEARNVVQVEEIGKKTRERLAEERKKRKEIVHLSSIGDNAAVPDIMERKSKSKEGGNKRPKPSSFPGHAPKSTRSRVRRRMTSGKRRASPASDSNTIVDPWMPDTSDLDCQNLPRDQRSNIVRLHGLPQDVKPEHIKKFFAGLNPKVFALPTYSPYMQGFDCPDGGRDRDNSTGLTVKRHGYSFRVFAKFASTPVADAAIERAGEAIFTDFHCDSTEKRIGAAIAIAAVPKHIAAHLHRHMAIDCAKGSSIQSAISRTENHLARNITKVLWGAALKVLHVGTSRSEHPGTAHDEFLSSIGLDDAVDTQDVQSDTVLFRDLSQKHNNLLNAYQEMEIDSTPFLMYDFNPSFPHDSVQRLTLSASNWFIEEIEVIQQKLRCCRRDMLARNSMIRD